MPDTRFITEFDQYLFGQGTHYDLYNKLGAHPMTVDEEEGVYFAVWAPNAAAVSIVGDFNEWDENATPMERLEPLGIYQIFLTGIKVGDIYKYCVTTKAGYTILCYCTGWQKNIKSRPLWISGRTPSEQCFCCGRHF